MVAYQKTQDCRPYREVEIYSLLWWVVHEVDALGDVALESFVTLGQQLLLVLSRLGQDVLRGERRRAL